MNKFKINLAIVAILLGSLGAFAFKAPQHVQKNDDDPEWFQYNGGGISDPSNYTITDNGGTDLPDCPTGTAVRCAVHALPSSTDASQPDLDAIETVRTKAAD
jgi:hypothetical protein